jgi:hypothetical protein
MTSTTVTPKLKITLNEREVQYVFIEYISWHEDQVCDEHQSDCTMAHRDLEILSTHTFAEFIAQPEKYDNWVGVTHVHFKTDASFLTYDILKSDKIWSTTMIPIRLIGRIHADSEEPDFEDEEEINHLNLDVKKSLK